MHETGFWCNEHLIENFQTVGFTTFLNKYPKNEQSPIQSQTLNVHRCTVSQIFTSLQS